MVVCVFINKWNNCDKPLFSFKDQWGQSFINFLHYLTNPRIILCQRLNNQIQVLNLVL